MLAIIATLSLASIWLLNPQPSRADTCTDIRSCSITPQPPGTPATLDVTVAGIVKETALELQGYAAPGSFVLVSDETGVIGAGTTQSNGKFDFLIHALQGNSTHSISIVAVKSDSSQVTPATAFVVTVAANTITTVSNIVLPTFIDVSPTTQNPGQPITVSGTTVPGGTVAMSIESPLQSKTVTADASGNWSIELISNFGPLPVGNYDAFAVVTYNSHQANQSRKVNFQVQAVASTTKLVVNGWGAPGAFLSYRDGTSVVGSGVVANDGTFSNTLTFPDANKSFTLGIVADNGSQITPATTMAVNLVAYNTTTINNVMLPTFIDVSPTSQNPGQPITVSGTTVPGGTVDMSIESPVQSITLTADASGNWTTELIADFGTLPAGQYDAYATVTHNTYQSIQSRKVNFQVTQVPFSTKLTVNGYGPPGAFLSFKNGTSVIGSGLVNSSGTFSQTLTFADSDQTINLAISADNGSQITPDTTMTVNIVAYTTTTVNNVLLPTFIDVTPVTANVGAPITVSGLGSPTAVSTLTIASPTKTTTVTLDGGGNWSKELISTFGALPQGSYTAQATLTQGSMTSVASRIVNFQVMETQTSTKLKVDGFTAPNAFLTFTENNAVVGTAVAKADGTFDQTLQFPDVTMTRTVSIVADNGSQQTPATTFTATLNAFNETDVANLVLPTFIDVTPLKVPFGTTVTALGTATPGSKVRLFIQSPLASTDLTAGTDGKWTGDLNALFGQLQKGTYTAYARVYVNGSYQSNLSRQISFDVVDSDQCANRRSDLNCDGKVDITDVGILIYYWGTAGAGQKADINKDGVVDVSDVGIMVYDWTY